MASSASTHPTRDSQTRRRLDRMSPAQRRKAAGCGQLTRSELSLWASAYPDEVPLVNGELPWIALGLADLDP